MKRHGDRRAQKDNGDGVARFVVLITSHCNREVYCLPNNYWTCCVLHRYMIFLLTFEIDMSFIVI